MFSCSLKSHFSSLNVHNENYDEKQLLCSLDVISLIDPISCGLYFFAPLDAHTIETMNHLGARIHGAWKWKCVPI